MGRLHIAAFRDGWRQDMKEARAFEKPTRASAIHIKRHHAATVFQVDAEVDQADHCEQINEGKAAQIEYHAPARRKVAALDQA